MKLNSQCPIKKKFKKKKKKASTHNALRVLAFQEEVFVTHSATKFFKVLRVIEAIADFTTKSLYLNFELR